MKLGKVMIAIIAVWILVGGAAILIKSKYHIQKEDENATIKHRLYGR